MAETSRHDSSETLIIPASVMEKRLRREKGRVERERFERSERPTQPDLSKDPGPDAA